MSTGPEPLSTLRIWSASVHRVAEFFIIYFDEIHILNQVKATLILFDAIQPCTERLFVTHGTDRSNESGWVNRALRCRTELLRSILDTNRILRRTREMSIACVGKNRDPGEDEISNLYESFSRLSNSVSLLDHGITLTLKEVAWLHSCTPENVDSEVDVTLLIPIRYHSVEKLGSTTEMRYDGRPFFRGNYYEMTKLTPKQQCDLRNLLVGLNVSISDSDVVSDIPLLFRERVEWSPRR